MSDRVVLNVGGRRFVTFLSTLRQFPDTVLGTMFAEDNMPMAKTVDPQEYFFDRNGDVFAVIIEFYRNGGRLFLPDKWEKFTREMLAAELDYFQIPHDSSLLPNQPGPPTDSLEPPTDSLEHLASTLPASKRYLSDLRSLCLTRAHRIMRLYGNFLLRLFWLGIEFSHSRGPTEIGPKMRLDLKFSEDGAGPIFLQTASLNLTRRYYGDRSPGSQELLARVPSEEWQEVDWSALISFLEMEPETSRESPYLRGKEEGVLKWVRDEFVLALAKAMGDAQALQNILVDRTSNHRCVVRIEINGDRFQ